MLPFRCKALLYHKAITSNHAGTHLLLGWESPLCMHYQLYYHNYQNPLHRALSLWHPDWMDPCIDQYGQHGRHSPMVILHIMYSNLCGMSFWMWCTLHTTYLPLHSNNNSKRSMIFTKAVPDLHTCHSHQCLFMAILDMLLQVSILT